MSGKKPYFPNNWKLYKDCDPEMFMPHTFLDLMDWKVRGWELRPDVYCIIRATNLENKRVKEYVYRSPEWADKRIEKLLNLKTHEFTITTNDAQHYVGPTRQTDDEEEF
tara:strand:+ start:1016 stop:1342 length:327 start_codon:yes stop_codon:yes gene_type:complete